MRENPTGHLYRYVVLDTNVPCFRGCCGRDRDVQLPVQSVSITTKVVSSIPANGEVYSIQQYATMFVSDFQQSTDLWFSPGKIDRHSIIEIMLKVALITITTPCSISVMYQRYQL